MQKFLNRLALATVLTSASASAQVMVGAYVPGSGFERSEIVNYNTVVPKSLAFVNIFTSFSHDWDHLYWQTSNVVGEGAMPLISWMPIDLDRPDVNILSEIALGLHDDYLDQWARKLADWVATYPVEQQPKILLRFGHEFNGNWYAYGNSPFFFQSAWQYIHDKFEAAGVNEHVEWVWSANNVSVDDYDDITSYYPGSEYVDWTSIDGYNFGSNYSWSEWESFSTLYSDTYLTLVENYPEKPILIAEIGSAEQKDLPDHNWGQFGDNSDGIQSKEFWISSFLTDLENSFPAVRAISWFNINKELDWSLTGSGNTGMSSWINGVQSDYYTADFLSAPSDDFAKSVELAALDAKLNAAQEAYDLAQGRFEASEYRLAQLEGDLQREEANSQSILAKRTESFMQMTAAHEIFLSARNDYMKSRQSFFDSRNIFISKRSDMTENREMFFDRHNAYRQSIAKRHNARLEFSRARQRYVKEKNEFLEVLKYFQQSRDQYLGLDQSADSEAHESVQEEYKLALAAYREAGDAFRPERSRYLEQLQLFREASGLFKEAWLKRRDALTQYRRDIAEMKTARGKYLASITDKNTTASHLTSMRHQYYMKNNSHLEIDKIYDEKLALLAQLKEEYSEAQTLNQSFSEALLTAQQKLSGVRGERRLYSDDLPNVLMLSDDGNSNNKDKANKDKGDAKEQELVAKENKKLAKKVKIDKAAQKALAQSQKPDPLDPVKVKERKEKYKNMSKEEKAALKQQKLTVLDY